MTLIFLGIVFLLIIVLLALKRPLYIAIAGGLLGMILLYRMPVSAILGQTANVFINWSSLSVLVSLYLICVLQRMLAARNQIRLAGQDLNNLFHNRRVNAIGAPLFIGLLPSAAAMILCGDIVREATDGYLDPREQGYITSWIRHIPESTLPTYSGVLLMGSITGLPLSKFILAMIIPCIVLLLLPYLVYLRRLPKDPGTPASENRRADALNLFKHLWSLIVILVLILAFGMNVVPAVLISILLSAVVYRFSLKEMGRMIATAFDWKLLLNTFVVLVLKEFIAYTGALELLPEMLSKLAIPGWLVFALLFFLGGIISGTSGIIALGAPLAFAALPDGGIPLMVLLMCMSHAASQISPTHVCLVVVSEYYDITVGEQIRKTLPWALIFCVLMLGYYLLMTAVF